MKKLIPILLICSFGLSFFLKGQVNSRNGYWMPQHDTVRYLMVFAEVVGDTLDPQRPGQEVPGYNNWEPGSLPDNAEDYLDPIFTDASSISSKITRWYYQMSFEKYVVLGDYFPELIQIEWNQMTGDGQGNLLNILATHTTLPNLPSGLPSEPTLFNKWTKPGTNNFGTAKTQTPDDYFDGLVVVWRTNSRYKPSNNSGSANPFQIDFPMLGFEGPIHPVAWLQPSDSYGPSLWLKS